MSEHICPMCQSPLKTTTTGCYRCQSLLCRGICIDRRLVLAPKTADNWAPLLCAARELQQKHHGEPIITFDGTTCYAQCSDVYGSGRVHEIRAYPQTVHERAMKLLAALARRTTDFGQRLELDGTDYPLAYVDSWSKLPPYLHYLQENHLLTIHLESLGDGATVSLTAAGLEASEGGSSAPDKIVFISSTCRDLMDCRDELARHLRDLGYVVRMSEQPSSFELPDDAGALASCLHNVKTSDVVVAILDGRYGSTIAIGDHAGQSVTHAEIDTAFSCKVAVLAFIRRPAFLDWEMLRTDPAVKSTWVEPADETSRHGWVRLVSQLMHHTQDGLQSRWIDQFNTVVDLKSLVTQRLRSLNMR